MAACHPTSSFTGCRAYFELTGAECPPLTDHQIDCIVAHDRMVSAQHPRGESMIKIGVMLDLMRDGSFDRAKGTESVRRMLAAQFEHVIDPLAGGPDQQAKLNRIHDLGRLDPKTGAIMRC